MTKTGSTALEAALRPECEIVMSGAPQVKHMPLRRFERFIRPYLDAIGAQGVETFCLFREPVDWLGSWYRYRQRDAIAGKPASTRGMDFDAFVQAYMQEEQPVFARIGNPATFVSDKSGRVAIDHLFRYDQMDAALRFLSERFDRPVATARLNISPAGDCALSADTRQRLQRHLAPAFDIYETIAR